MDYNKLKQAFIDIIENQDLMVSSPLNITKQLKYITDLSEKRCKEIEEVYKELIKEK